MKFIIPAEDTLFYCLLQYININSATLGKNKLLKTNLFLKLKKFELTLQSSLILKDSHFLPHLNSLLSSYYIIFCYMRPY